MSKNNTSPLEKARKLKDENKKRQHRLLDGAGSVDVVKTGSIDALVSIDKEDITVYTEKIAGEVYRILIEKMHEGAVTLNEEGTILYCNSYFAGMVNEPLQKVIGTKLKTYMDHASMTSFMELFNQGHDASSQSEVYLMTKEGRKMPVLLSANTLTLNKNIILSIILTDLTIQNKNQKELKYRAEQLEQKNVELENVNKDLTTFTYISSHDLQEPVRKILNFGSIITKEEGGRLSDTGKEYFRRLMEAAKRMQGLIEDLATYSLAKHAERNFEKIDLTTLVDEVKKDLDEVIQEKHATLETTFLGTANIIPFQFRQLVHNLILNSLKFSKQETAPVIRMTSEIVAGSQLNQKKLSSQIDYYHITYTDNGIGFEPKYNELIFEVLQRLHSREEYKGTGMGLAICKRIIENHNGIITATGELNVGARFDIYIPAL